LQSEHLRRALADASCSFSMLVRARVVATNQKYKTRAGGAGGTPRMVGGKGLTPLVGKGFADRSMSIHPFVYPPPHLFSARMRHNVWWCLCAEQGLVVVSSCEGLSWLPNRQSS
ncbi:unnamed protein product, partial [Ectocarpus sp. 12 AP-2014]